MSLTAAHLDALVESGATAEQIVALVKVDIAEREAATAARRNRDSERQRRHRESRDVTVTDAVSQQKVPLEVSPHTPLPKPLPKSAPLNPPVDRIMGEWNGMAEKHKLPTIERITGNRLKALRQRTAEHGPDAISRAIANVPNSPHWLGANGWLGNFDSLLRPDNFQRMLENTYAEGAGAQKFVSAGGHQYRGDLDAVIREAEKRADWTTFYAAKSARDGEARAA